MDFNFFMPVRVISGENAVQKHSTLFKDLGKRCLIVTGGSSAKVSGALNDVTAALDVWEIGYAVFDGISANPKVTDCYNAGVAARSVRAEFIIGIGGGSALDASKAVAIFASNPDLQPIDIYKRVYENKKLPLAVVGTTAGTGSEVSGVSVLTMENGRKKSISGADCYADIAFADPQYTHSAPFGVTVSTALDAFAHTVEGWLNPSIPDAVKIFGEKAIKLLWNGLFRLNSSNELPDSALREQLYYGSLYAGMVLNACGTAFPHPFGYVLTEDFGIPHGRACTTFMPALLKRAEEKNPDALREFLLLANSDINDVIRIVTALTDTADITMTEEQAKAYSERWEGKVGNFDNTPGGFSASEAFELFNQLFVKY